MPDGGGQLTGTQETASGTSGWGLSLGYNGIIRSIRSIRNCALGS